MGMEETTRQAISGLALSEEVQGVSEYMASVQITTCMLIAFLVGLIIAYVFWKGVLK